MKQLFITLILVFLTSCGEVTFEAESGEFKGLGYEPVTDEASYIVNMSLLEIQSGEKWSAFLSFGMVDLQTEDRLEVYLQHYSPEHNTLTAGYRYVKDEVVVNNVHLVNGIPVGTNVSWEISWNDKREFTIQFEDNPPVTITIPLRNLSSFVKISSGKGKIQRKVNY